MTDQQNDPIRDEIEGQINVTLEFTGEEDIVLTLTGHKDLVGSLLTEQARADLAAGLEAQRAAAEA